MDTKPTVVVLCGSSRFKDAFIEANRNETLAGKIVLSIGMFGHGEGLDMDGSVKAMLDQLHLRKIDLADEVLILNPTVVVCGGCGKPSRPYTDANGVSVVTECCRSQKWSRRPYIGESTAREIAYATSLGKPIRYLVQE